MSDPVRVHAIWGGGPLDCRSMRLFFRRRPKSAVSQDQAPRFTEPSSGSGSGSEIHKHSIDITAAGVKIDDTLLETLTVSSLTEVLGPPRVVPPDDPTPDDRGIIASTLVVWDLAGIFAFTKDGDEVGALCVRLANDPDGEAEVKFDFASNRPSQIFSGPLTVDGRTPLDAIPDRELRKAYIFLDANTGNWTATFSLNVTECGELRRMEFAERLAKSETDELADRVRAAAHPFAWVSINYSAPKVVRKSSGRWKHPVQSEPSIELAAFPFRLAVIQELMYEQDVLSPRFDVYDFAQDQGTRSFDPDEVGYEIIPSVRAWFRTLPIPARLAERVETLTLDGGNDIYLQLIPHWDGEDDAFDINSLKESDIAPFTRLTKVQDIGGFLGPRARAALIKCGIEVEG